MSKLALIGRSSSHFTRIARIFAAELGVDVELEVVRDLTSTDAAAFGGNPALSIPSLRTSQGVWFGALNVTRVLGRYAADTRGILWPEHVNTLVACNAQEVTLSAMNAGVVIITGKVNQLPETSPALTKPLLRLQAAIAWLEEHLEIALQSLPERRTSFLEVSAYAFLSHLSFRGLGNLDAQPKLTAFCARFAERPAALATPYRFD
jgi:glutathione S-transferase